MESWRLSQARTLSGSVSSLPMAEARAQWARTSPFSTSLEGLLLALPLSLYKPMSLPVCPELYTVCGRLWLAECVWHNRTVCTQEFPSVSGCFDNVPMTCAPTIIPAGSEVQHIIRVRTVWTCAPQPVPALPTSRGCFYASFSATSLTVGAVHLIMEGDFQMYLPINISLPLGLEPPGVTKLGISSPLTPSLTDWT